MTVCRVPMQGGPSREFLSDYAECTERGSEWSAVV